MSLARGKYGSDRARSAWRRTVRSVLAAVVSVGAVFLAGPAVSVSAHLATPTARQTARQAAASAPTECPIDLSGGIITDLSGCFDKDQRLGPTQLPTTGSAGSVYAYIAKITAGYERFGTSKTADAFLTKYWVNKAWQYPPHGGFKLGADEKPDHAPFTLTKGHFVDRFGCGIGTYLAPVATSFAKRALPPQTLDTYSFTTACPFYHYNYHLYTVLKAFNVDAGKIAPGFGQPGDGIQYVTCMTSEEELDKPYGMLCKGPNVNDLVKDGHLQEQALPLN